MRAHSARDLLAGRSSLAIASDSVSVGARDRMTRIVGGASAIKSRIELVAGVSGCPNNAKKPSTAPVHTGIIIFRVRSVDMVEPSFLASTTSAFSVGSMEEEDRIEATWAHVRILRRALNNLKQG